MKDLYELRSMLCKELKEYGKKDLSAGSLDVIDKLAHAIKNIDKIIKAEKSGEYWSESAYSRKRDSMGRYSRDAEMVAELRELHSKAPDDRTREEIEKLIDMVESM